MASDLDRVGVQLVGEDMLSGPLTKARGELQGFGQAAQTTTSHFGSLGAAVGRFSAGVGGALSHAKSAIGGLLTGPLGMVGLAGGVFGVEQALTGAAHSAMNFQQSMTLLQTQTGASAAEVKDMSSKVLELAKTLPQSPEDLAAGLYHVESAGMRGSKALDVLRIAAQGAATGGADLESVVNAIVGAEQSGIKGAEDLGTAMGTLNAIVGSGNMRMQDLADAFGTGIAATARTFGASLQSVGAALATLTDEGIPATDAATRLRMSINLLGAPTSRSRDNLKSIGLSATDLATAMRGPNGLVAAVEMLHGAMAKAGMIDEQGVTTKGAQFLSESFGGGRSSSAIMTLIGNLGLLDQKFAAVNKGAAGFGDAVTAASQTAAWKMATFQSTLQVLAIKIGNVLLPIATDLAESWGNWLGDPANEASIIGGLTSIIDLAGKAGEALGAILRPILSAWGALPDELKTLLIGGFVAQKASKWLLGSGPLDWGKGLVGSLLGRVPGGSAVAAATGMTTGTPVFVTNWPAGFGVGVGAGAIGSAIEGAAGAEGGLAILGGMSLGAAVTMIAGIVLPLAAIYIATQVLPSDPTRNTARTGGSPTIGYGDTGTGATGPTGSGGAGAFTKGTGATGPMAGTGLPVTQSAAGGLTVNAQTGFVTAGTSPTVNAQTGFVTGGLWRSGFDAVKNATTAAGATTAAALDTLHADFVAQRDILRASNDPTKVGPAVTAILKDVLGGVGGPKSTANLLEQLKAERLLATDPATQRLLDDAITKVASHLKGEQWIQAQKDAATKIAASNKPIDEKLTDLKAIERDLLSHGDTAAAKIVSAIETGLRLSITIAGTGTGTYSAVAHPVGGPTKKPKSGTYEYAGPGRAAGGDVEPGVLYPIGEHGPEWLAPRVPGTVVTSETLAGIVSAALRAGFPSAMDQAGGRVAPQPIHVTTTVSARDVQHATTVYRRTNPTKSAVAWS